MDDVCATSFASDADLPRMLEALRARMPGFEWRMGESHFEGDYVRGVDAAGVKLRILAEGGRYCVEAYFPLHDDARSAMTDEAKRAILARIEVELLPAVGARDPKPA